MRKRQKNKRGRRKMQMQTESSRREGRMLAGDGGRGEGGRKQDPGQRSLRGRDLFVGNFTCQITVTSRVSPGRVIGLSEGAIDASVA
jgi:hypothetical protein